MSVELSKMIFRNQLVLHQIKLQGEHFWMITIRHIAVLKILQLEQYIYMYEVLEYILALFNYSQSCQLYIQFCTNNVFITNEYQRLNKVKLDDLFVI